MTCETCGAEVTVVGNVTMHYEPVYTKERFEGLEAELKAACKVVECVRQATWDDVVDGNIVVGGRSWKRIQASLDAYDRVREIGKKK